MAGRRQPRHHADHEEAPRLVVQDRPPHPQGSTFRFYPAQRDAIETLIYLFEVKKIRRRADLLLSYAKGQKVALPVRDDFARYAIKMATGSGKTKVMALAMAWQYFNAVRGEGDEYATTFLLIAPNVIVLERLATDFAGGRIFRTDPIIPPAFKIDWEFDVYVRGDAEKTRSQGALYLTDIQQLYGQAEESEEPNPVAEPPRPHAARHAPAGRELHRPRRAPRQLRGAERRGPPHQR